MTIANRIRTAAIRLGRTPELDESTFYGAEAQSEQRWSQLTRALDVAAANGGRFAVPTEAWTDNYYDSVAQGEVYDFLRDTIIGGRVAQLGGTGKEAVKSLLGGAASAVLVTPVEEEAELARRLASHYGVAAKLTAVIGCGEAIPLEAGSIDAVIAEGCLHHTNVSEALVEIHRVLRPGGRFGAFDPWHARLYDIGTAVFGKREPGIECRPLNPSRLETLTKVFPNSHATRHGAVVRYPLIALGKLGWNPPSDKVRRWTELDDRISGRWRALERNGSCVTVLATKADDGGR